jgi:pyruvate/2-oxoglutarate dehydrogenase complex dihydrolipoamide acyltransferase (E2) component
MSRAVLGTIFAANLLLVGAACGGANPTARATSSAPSASPFTASSAVPSVSTSAAPAGAPFLCADATGTGTQRANVVAVRADRNAGFDLFVIEFDGPVPGYRVTRQDSANFTQDASGRPVTLEGTAGVVVRLEPAASLASAPLAVAPDSTVLREGRQIGDFEGVVRWGLGLATPACLRVQTLSEPNRLVIDFQTT